MSAFLEVPAAVEVRPSKDVGGGPLTICHVTQSVHHVLSQLAYFMTRRRGEPSDSEGGRNGRCHLSIVSLFMTPPPPLSLSEDE